MMYDPAEFAAHFTLRDGVEVIELPDGGALLIDLYTNDVARFNSSGASVLLALTAGSRLDACVEQLATTYGCSDDECGVDVMEFANSMRARGWIIQAEVEGPY